MRQATLHVIAKGNFPLIRHAWHAFEEPYSQGKTYAFIIAQILCIKKSRIQNCRAFQSLSSC